MVETDTKATRVARLAEDVGVAGILLGTQANFAWLTGGATNRIDGSGETGAGCLLIAADGRRFVLANRIEMPRLLDEALHDLHFEPYEFPWTTEQVDADLLVKAARALLGAGAPIGADSTAGTSQQLAPQITRLRAPLTPDEISRYTRFGQSVGQAVGDLCRRLVPGAAEEEVAAEVNGAMLRLGARALVTLVGADDRIARYRHPVPTSTRWRERLLVGLCAERDGLVVALSRVVSAGPVDSSWATRTHAAADVFAQLLSATREGATGARLFAAARDAYARGGFPGEEERHHQGGAIGYRPRDWIAHPASDEIVTTPQAFAWNPSVTGTKVEDTAIVSERGVELISSSPGWPSIETRAREDLIAVADVLTLG